jgi:hypothetical protein
VRQCQHAVGVAQERKEDKELSKSPATRPRSLGSSLREGADALNAPMPQTLEEIAEFLGRGNHRPVEKCKRAAPT